MRKRDRELGMGRAITRRDLLNGAGIAITGSLAFPWACRTAPSPVDSRYPPALTGLRGSHEGSFEVAHQMRDGKRWPNPDATGETYDLVVVGGGLSGLAAAYFYRQQAGPEARILILDNHDDFGGHAKRNEFHYDGQVLLSHGGTINIEDFNDYGKAARRLFRDLGIDPNRYDEFIDEDLFRSRGMGRGLFLDRDTFGDDHLIVRESGESTADFLAQVPLAEEVRREIVSLYEDQVDYLPGMSLAQKRDLLRSVSYEDYLLHTVKIHPDAIPFLRVSPGYWAIGMDALSAWAGVYSGYPGLTGLGFSDDGPERNYFAFPDGNASIARLIVRSLNPRVATGSQPGMEGIVSARFDYSMLDREDIPVRIRLDSTAIHVAHVGQASTAREVDATYVRQGTAERVRARHCILACYNAAIPHLCPELPEDQRRALSQSLKAPLVYTSVLIRNWTALEKLGVRSLESRGSYWNSVRLRHPVTIGDYRPGQTPQDPTVLSVSRIPLAQGLPAQEQWRAGRADLLDTTFETFERNLRDELGRMLADGGFDPARDIEGITVNRWPHGYAYGQDPETGEVAYVGDEMPLKRRPWRTARQPHGRIAIANSDAAANAMTEAALRQAYRAVIDLSEID